MGEAYTSPWAGFYPLDNIVPDRLLVEPGKARKVTIPGGTGIVRRGTVVGKVTASREYLPAKKAATDGSQVPDAIIADTVDATGPDDVETIAYIEGTYNANALILGDGLVLADVDDAFRTKSIFLETSLT